VRLVQIKRAAHNGRKVATTRERRINEKKSIYEKRNKIEKQQQTQTYA
jgi:hypothetical protein